MGGGEDKWTMGAELARQWLSTPKRPEAPTASGMMMFSLGHAKPRDNTKKITLYNNLGNHDHDFPIPLW